MSLDTQQNSTSRATWIAERSKQAMVMLRDTVVIDPDIRNGVPVLKGTRFTIPQLFAEIADGRSVDQLARAFSLDVEQIRDFLHGLANHLDS
ncbi:MAG: DUF433 domain-containing protein [Planctomycetes bacterium]|nr:DUF433 domain-containing protein [Planctomycetota bacterium]